MNNRRDSTIITTMYPHPNRVHGIKHPLDGKLYYYSMASHGNYKQAKGLLPATYCTIRTEHEACRHLE